jgi:hypothetical protein
MIAIPMQLQDPGFRFTPILRGQKKPDLPNWQRGGFSFDDPIIRGYLEAGHQYGVLTGVGGLVVLDIDEPDLVSELAVPETLTVQTGSGGFHYYLRCLGWREKIVLQRDGVHLGELQALGQQVVGPGSLHPNGNLYRIVRDVPIATITKNELARILRPYRDRVSTNAAGPARRRRSYRLSPIRARIEDIAMPDNPTRRGSEIFGSHPIHGSKTGRNFAIDTETDSWHCFRHRSGGGPLEWIAVMKGIIDCSEARAGCLR